MNSNVIGRVRNIALPNSKGLLPLFEAIINSIDAIEDANINLDEGNIKVKILRSFKPLLDEKDESDSRVLSPFIGFEVIDNGIGFNDLNYEAFNELDTLYKQKRGGKGVGRFLWLKAFEKVEIDSTFRDDGKTWQRTFIFSLANPTGIRDHSLVERLDDPEIRTIVRLDGFKTQYEENIPRSATSIAQRIVEHCLEYFILGNMPSVQVIDELEDTPIILERLFESLVSENEVETVNIKGVKFDIIHLLLNAHADLKHQIYYCGNHRVVLAEKVGNLIPNLKSTLSKPGNDSAYVYSGYVSSDYLDQHADQQRTGFDTMPEDGSLFSKELKWSEIPENILAASKAFLQPYTEEVEFEKKKRSKISLNTEAPEYRYIVANYPEKLDKIPPDFSKRELDLKLHEIHREIEEKFIDETGELLEEETLDEEYIKDQFSKWLQDWNDVGKANLAKYIVHRKSVLTILEKALQVQVTDRYAREEVIHRIIFPIRSTSNKIRYNEHNLWILDEKLAYHEYVASDIPLNRNEKLEFDLRLRPDLLLFFDRPIAVVGEEYPYTSGAVIFEFKRPMRDDYEEDDNPIDQVFKYVTDIRNGKEKTKDSRPFNIPNTAPIYCYLVCDITPRLEAIIEQYDYQRTPDGCGYFGFNSRKGTYIEIIGFDKLVSDAKKRNSILFEQLGVPDTYD